MKRQPASRQNLLEKAGRTFSIAQLENKRGRVVALAAWGAVVVGAVLLLALLVGFSNKHAELPSPQARADLLAELTLFRRSGPGAEDLPHAMHEPGMLAGTGAVFLGKRFEDALKLGRREVEVSVPGAGPTQGTEELAGHSVDEGFEVTTGHVEGSEEEVDPDGAPTVADLESGPGSIMRPQIEWPAGSEPEFNGTETDGELGAEIAAVGSTKQTRPRTTRKSTRRTTTTQRTPPRSTAVPVTNLPVSRDFRCGQGAGTQCPSGLCCSQYDWCGVTDGHCAQGCQRGFGRCNGFENVLPPAPPAPPSLPSPPAPPVPSRPPGRGAGVVMYLANWGPQDISGFDLNGIDVINYAFVSMRQDGSLTSGGDYARGGMQYTLNKVLKDRYPGLRTVFSIGGWTDSQWFSVVAADPTRRARFADAVRSYMVNNRFDGVDIDWEYPGGGGQPGNTASQDDARNFVLMVRDIRDRIGQDALITAAVSADVSKLGNYAVPLANLFDWINVMTYDMAGGWSGSSGLNAPLDDQARAMEGFVRAGVPRAKLSMGLAFYGRGFFVDSGTNGGLGQRITGLPSMDGTDEPGVWAWRGLRRTILAAGPTTPAAGWQRTYLSNLHTPTLWNAARRIFVGYDDTVSTCNKAKWVREQGYGGVMVWEFTQDFNSELARATTEAWRGLRPNC